VEGNGDQDLGMVQVNKPAGTSQEVLTELILLPLVARVTSLLTYMCIPTRVAWVLGARGL
jgi:hypothetical protein